MKTIKTEFDNASAENMFTVAGYYRIDLPEFPGIVYEKESDGGDVVTRLYIYLDGSISKSYYVRKDEMWEASGSILYIELIAIYQQHKEMDI